MSNISANAAVADAQRMITLYRRDLRSANTSIVAASDAFTHMLGERPVEPFAVAATTIDTLAATLGGRVDFLKIDVEGAEPLVLAGARDTIAANPQIQIVMEWSPGQIEAANFQPQAVVELLDTLGLEACDLNKRGRPIAITALATLPYRAGVLLRRRAPATRLGNNRPLVR